MPLLVLHPLLESWDDGMPKAKRRVPGSAGRGAALELCKGLARRAPQEQLDAADPLVMQGCCQTPFAQLSVPLL